MGSIRLSVDVGGTFTDLVALDEETGSLVNVKVPTIPKNPEQGIMNSVEQYLAGDSSSRVRMIGHATTIATNALFGQVDLDLPKVALVTTRGFSDVVEIGRQRRAEVYNLFFQRPPSLVERGSRYELSERVEHDGSSSKPVDRAELDALLRKIKEENYESLAVAFLNSYANPSHEEQVAAEARRMQAAPYVTASTEISREYREYERFSTAIVNAALLPLIHRYITGLQKELHHRGLAAPLYVMQSNGGLASAAVTSEKPATIVESGPAAGVIAAAWVGDLAGLSDIISFDMGGTTAKAGTVRGRHPEVVPEYEVAGRIHMGRLVKGSGYPVRFPFIDLAECSSGGGTIAWVDDGGVLRLGPTSAGAYPGPACYGRGGDQPTITDANLYLGRLNPGSLLSGEMSIYPEKAVDSLRKVGSLAGLSPEETAVGIIRLANSMMGKILRIVSVERGFDPRFFSMVAFGGAGPMHACALAEELEIQRILVPPNPGMFSALGLLTADLFHDYSAAVLKRIRDADSKHLADRFHDMEAQGRATLESEGVSEHAMSFQRQVDLRYVGQAYELSITLGGGVSEACLREAERQFHVRHQETYGYSSPGEPVELVNIRLRAVGAIPKPQLTQGKTTAPPEESGRRRVYFEGVSDWVETPVLQRGSTLWKGKVEGPAIIEQYDATTVVSPGWGIEMDRYGSLILRRARQ